MVSYEEALLGLRDRIPSRMVPDLDRIRSLAELLGDPQTLYPSIHITGTNGKTSVARMVTALLGALGIQAGTYTSPHLQDVRERIRVADQPMTRRDFVDAYEAVAPAARMVDAQAGADGEHVTYFEFLTAMAYWWFADHPVDVGVFEVGMGGTWDATNLVRGDVAVIGPVNVDHRELGSTPAEVAHEKAGIVKAGATVVVAPQPAEVKAVIRARAEEVGARLLLLPDDVAVEDQRVAVDGQLVSLRTPTRRHGDVFLPLHGRHQAGNAALALGAVHALLGDLEAVDDRVLREGFGAVSVPGRLEVVERDPTVVLDGAHNPHGARRLAETIEQAFAFRDLIVVIGCLRDKDVAGVLAALREVASHVVVTRAPSSRGMATDELAGLAERTWAGTGVAVEEAPDVGSAVAKAVGVAGEDDGVLVTGSLYTVGAARDRFVPFDDPDDLPDPPAEELRPPPIDLDELLGGSEDQSPDEPT